MPPNHDKGKTNERRKEKKQDREIAQHLQHIKIHVAGIDVGSRSHFVAVAEGTQANLRYGNSKVSPTPHTAWPDWLITCKVSIVVMESTGIYWIPDFKILESKVLEVKLDNAHHVK